MFSGSFVAIVTPFTDDGRLDEHKLRELVEFQIGKGTNGLVPCGTTGESPTLSHDEHKRVIEITVETAAGRVPVIAGAGSNSTSETVELAEFAKKVGADGALVITPYYNKPTQGGLYLHYKKVTDSVDIPVIIYNVPGRTGVNIEPDTIIDLAKIPNIVGLKAACGNLDNVSRVLGGAPDMDVLSGDDGQAVPMMAIGAKGVISVAANIVPDKVSAMIGAALAGNWAEAKELHYDLFELCRVMFIETNPVPVKTSMRLMNMINGNMRLPLCPMAPANEKKLEAVLKAKGLLV